MSAESKKSKFAICCARLCTNKFNQTELRSNSSMLSNKDLQAIDTSNAVRGRWNNRIEFLLSCIGFAVGLGNVWRFPIRVYESGGGAFLLPYTILCLALGVPLLLLELGVAQFSGRGPTKAFKLVPVMYGIGWSMVLVSVFIEVYYAAIIAWSYFYLFGSLTETMPWTVCTHEFNTKNCLGSTEDTQNRTKNSTYFIASTAEYWDYYVTGFMKYPSREIYTMNEDPGSPQWHLALCLLLTWIVSALALMSGVKISGKIMYFSVLYPYVALFALFCLGCTLPGAMNGVKFYLTPDWKRVYEPAILRGAVEQLFFSCSIGMGGMLTYASYNDFRDNIYRDAIIVIFIDFLTSVLAGFAVFPILGYMSQRNGVPIGKVVTSGSSLFYITFTEALATLPAAQFWTFLLMLMAISLGMDSQFAMFETVSTGVIDAFPFLQNKPNRKAITVWTMSLFFFLWGLLLVTPGGKYWFDILDRRVSSFGLPLIALLETVCVGLIYGIKQLRYDFRMMLGFSLGWYWFIMMAYLGPIIILLILVASFISFDRIEVHGKLIPVWGEVIAFLCLFVILLPIAIGIIHTIISYKRKYPNLAGKEFSKKLFSPPIYWGPYYKRYWVMSDFYRQKLMKYKDDPIFLKYIPDCEDINILVSVAEAENPPE